MSQHLVVIEKTDSGARFALLRTRLRSSELLDVQTVDFSALAPDAEGAAINPWKTLRAMLPERVDRVVLGLSPGYFSSRVLSFPFSDPKKVEAAIGFELDGLLPCDASDLLVHWTRFGLSERKGTIQTLIVSGKRRVLLELIAEMKDADLEPQSLVPVPSVFDLLLPDEGVNAEGAFVVMCPSSEGGSLAVFDHGPCVMRRIPKVPLGEDVSSTLVTALQMSTRSIDVAQLRCIYLAGEYASDELADRMGSLVGVASVYLGPTVLASEPPEDLTYRLEEHAMLDALVAASLKYGRRFPLDLRQGDASFQGDSQELQGLLRRWASSGAVIVALMLIASVVNYKSVRYQERLVDRGFCDVTKRVMGREICDPTAAIASLTGSAGSADGFSIPSYTALDLLVMLSQEIGSNIDMQLEEIDIRTAPGNDEKDRMTGKGEADSFDTIEKTLTHLRAHPCVNKAEVSRQKKQSNSTRVEFSVAVDVQCPAGKRPSMAVASAENPPASPPVPASPVVPEPTGDMP